MLARVWQPLDGAAASRACVGRWIKDHADGRFIDWTPTGQAVWPSGNHESGAIALLRDEGILIMFNTPGWKKQKTGHQALSRA